VIPNTEIALVRAPSGTRSGEFLFSAETVARAGEFYETGSQLPYRRPLPLKDLHHILATGGAWMIPYAWIQSLPASLRAPIADQSAWKWIGLALLLAASRVVPVVGVPRVAVGRRSEPIPAGTGAVRDAGLASRG
jgi:MscS family membrane protein